MAHITFTEGSGLADSVFGKSQAPIRLFVEKKAEAFEQASMIKELFAVEKGKSWGEKMSGMTAFDGFQPVGENGPYPVDGMQEGFDKILTYETWKDSFSISKEAVDDAVVMNLKQKPAGFVTGYYRTRERFGAALYGGAIQGEKSVKFHDKKFDVTAADGEALFSKAHPSKLVKSRTQSNIFADEFSNEALAAMETAMQDFRGDNNEVLAVAPDTILIPNLYQLKMNIFAAIGADKDPNTSNNGFNYNFGRWNVIVWPYLNEFITAGTAPWILLDAHYNSEHGGAPWRDREELSVKSRIDDGNDANVWSGRARFSATFNDWRFAAIGGVTGGTALIS